MNKLKKFMDDSGFISSTLKHYAKRKSISNDLVQFLEDDDITEFIHMTFIEEDGNYSSYTKDGWRDILENNSSRDIFKLAKKMYVSNDTLTLIRTIKSAGLPYLKVGIGSEIAMLSRPNSIWLCNRRSTFGHSMVITNWAINNAKKIFEGASGLKNPDTWKTSLYRDMQSSMEEIYNTSMELLDPNLRNKFDRFLWADCVSNSMYEHYKNEFY